MWTPTRPPHVSYRFRLTLLRVATVPVPLPLPATDALEPALFRPFFVGDTASVRSGDSDDAVESLEDLRAGVFTSDGRAFALPLAAAVAVAVLPAGAVDLALDFDVLDAVVDVPKSPDLVRRDGRGGSGAIASSSSSCLSISESSSPTWSVSCSSLSSSINAPGIVRFGLGLLEEVLLVCVTGRLVPPVVVVVLFELRWG